MHQQEFGVLFEKTQSYIFILQPLQGGLEAQDFSQILKKTYFKWLTNNKILFNIIQDNQNRIILELIINKKTENLYELFQNHENGVHKLIRVSPFGNGKTHTSLVKAFFIKKQEKENIVLNNKDLIIESYKAPGPGGQHKNKTESAIRIKHIPTGTITTCSSSRNQFDNKKLALKQLEDKLTMKQLDELYFNKKEIYKKNLSEIDITRIYNLNSKLITDKFGNKTSQIKNFFNGDIY